MDVLLLAEVASVFIFGLTGAVVASRAQLDIVGFLFFACLTGVGGGTFRDLVLGRTPVFWVEAPFYLFFASAAAVLVFFVAPLVESRKQWLTWLDAAALAVTVPLGVSVAMEFTDSTAIALLMGVATGTFGGLMRDVIANEVPLLLSKSDMHASAAFIGAGAYMIGLSLGYGQTLCILISMVVTFVLRAGSLHFGWSLPRPRHLPPRT